MTAESTAARDMAGERVRRVLVLINRRAGGARRDPELAARLRRVVGRAGEVVATGDPGEIDAALRRALMDGVDTIGICGGDGTNHCTMTAVARVFGQRRWPRVALLAGGTVNTATTSLGFSGRIPDRLEALLSCESPRVHRTPLLSADGRVGFVLGTQMPARVMDAYYDGRVGITKCVWLAVTIAGSSLTGGAFAKRLFEPEPIELEIDGRLSPLRQATALVASVVPAITVGMRATYRAGEDDGFHLLATDAPPNALAREAGRFWAGLPSPVMNEDTVARCVRLEFAEPSRYMLDGDVFSAARLDIVATRPVELIGPPLDD